MAEIFNMILVLFIQMMTVLNFFLGLCSVYGHVGVGVIRVLLFLLDFESLVGGECLI